MKTIIFDLDGTLADLQHRIEFAKKKDYREFFARVLLDAPITDVIYMATVLKVAGHRIIICSGRSDESKGDTEAWLQRNKVLYDALYMRRSGDHRPDYVVKAEIYNQYIRDKEDVLCVFDDRDSVVALWRSLGLRCYQVAKGNF